MLTLQRRHSTKCPHKKKGPDYLKCRCPVRVCGMVEGKRLRVSLKTRDLRRAARRLAEMEQQPFVRARKRLSAAMEAFHAVQEGRADETRRKYTRLLNYLADYCARHSMEYLDQVSVEALDGYSRGRAKENWTWLKELELLRQFFNFCIDREWTTKNPAKKLRRPQLLEANDVQPYTREEIIRIIAACDGMGRASYERLRARAMVLLLRYTGMRISDVVTLSREHIQGNRLEKRAIKNRRWIRVELPAVVLEALERLPQPKAAPEDGALFFSSGKASLRSLVKGAQRTLSAVFQRAQVKGAHAHRFRHTLASEILAKGGTIEDAASILGDSPATIRRHYAKWTPEYQVRQDSILRMVHGTNLAQLEEQAPTC
jgi:site-specific recombinase XerD